MRGGDKLAVHSGRCEGYKELVYVNRMKTQTAWRDLKRRTSFGLSFGVDLKDLMHGITSFRLTRTNMDAC
jgi:hypothetical protein